MVILADTYRQETDFVALAMQFPAFGKKLKPNGQLDFSDPESLRQLTAALLKRDFNLTIDLPDDRLCPPVPNRFNYVNFIHNLIDTTRSDLQEGHDHSSKIIALDIGTGSSAIYPLLICRQRPNWLCLATEIDSKSREYAERNIQANDLSPRIRVVDTDQSGETILPSSIWADFRNNAIKIQMTNPPFYSSLSDLQTSTSLKPQPPPSKSTSASANELITPGGETAFVTTIITESILPRNRHKIQWFSSMLGKLSSVSVIVEELRKRECGNYAISEFVTGDRGKTRRWCVAWSWTGWRARDWVARGVEGRGVERKLLPDLTERCFVVDEARFTRNGSDAKGAIANFINAEIGKLDLGWRPNTSFTSTPSSPPSQSQSQSQSHTPPLSLSTQSRTISYVLGTGTSQTGDVWSRKARRRKQHSTPPSTSAVPGGATTKSDDDSEDGDDEDEESKKAKFIFRVSMLVPIDSDTDIAATSSSYSPSHSRPQQQKPQSMQIHVRWLYGFESLVFESFASWLKRKADNYTPTTFTA